jgi:HEPN domain-containing protein
MKSPRDHAQSWIAKGDHDLASARMVVQGGGPLDTACFLCQQAAEKYLKALFASVDQSIPLTHNLAFILDGLAAHYSDLGLRSPDVAKLTPYAVQLRYDLDFAPSPEQTALALQTAELVRERVLAVLPPDAHPIKSASP